MTFRKEDHQAMQSMYHFKIKVDPAFAWGVPELVREIKAEEMNGSHPQQALMNGCRLLRRPIAALRSARDPARTLCTFRPVQAARLALDCSLRRSPIQRDP
jgi:hypothetical protein